MKQPKRWTPHEFLNVIYEIHKSLSAQGESDDEIAQFVGRMLLPTAEMDHVLSKAVKSTKKAYKHGKSKTNKNASA